MVGDVHVIALLAEDGRHHFLVDVIVFHHQDGRLTDMGVSSTTEPAAPSSASSIPS
jgi:hypothetical protein